MRDLKIIMTGIVLSAVLFSSCTCHKDTPPATEFQEPPSGFHASGSKATPQARAQIPTETPATKAPPAQVAAVPTGTPAAQIPEDFPKDVPIPDGAVLAQVQPLANNAHNVIFTSSAPIPEVTSLYQDKMTQAGWKITQQFARPDHAFFTFSKGSTITNVTIAQDPRHPGQQVIAVMYEEQKPLDFDEF